MTIGWMIAMSSHNESSCEQQNSQSLEASFNVYHGTVAMGAIFIGFVFSSLLGILLSPDPLTPVKEVVLWILSSSMILFCAALVLFHATAHQFIKWCKAPYPRSIFSMVGVVCFTLGLTLMFASISALMYQRGLRALMVVTVLFGLGIAGFRFWSSAFVGTENMVKVDLDKPN
jgi:hypothetical protein